MIERYDPGISYGGAYSDCPIMEKDDEGGWVKFEEYEKLRKELIPLFQMQRSALEVERENGGVDNYYTEEEIRVRLEELGVEDE